MDFEYITIPNLRWFYLKFRNHNRYLTNRDYLTAQGCDILYKLALTTKYDISKQPIKIQNLIIKLLNTNPVGRGHAEELQEYIKTTEECYKQEIINKPIENLLFS